MLRYVTITLSCSWHLSAHCYSRRSRVRAPQSRLARSSVRAAILAPRGRLLVGSNHIWRSQTRIGRSENGLTLDAVPPLHVPYSSLNNRFISFGASFSDGATFPILAFLASG